MHTITERHLARAYRTHLVCCNSLSSDCHQWLILLPVSHKTVAPSGWCAVGRVDQKVSWHLISTERECSPPLWSVNEQTDWVTAAKRGRSSVWHLLARGACASHKSTTRVWRLCSWDYGHVARIPFWAQPKSCKASDKMQDSLHIPDAILASPYLCVASHYKVFAVCYRLQGNKMKNSGQHNSLCRQSPCR